MWCWHKWSKWGGEERAKQTVCVFGTMRVNEVWVQRRTCAKCGKIDVRHLGQR